MLWAGFEDVNKWIINLLEPLYILVPKVIGFISGATKWHNLGSGLCLWTILLPVISHYVPRLPYGAIWWFQLGATPCHGASLSNSQTERPSMIPWGSNWRKLLREFRFTSFSTIMMMSRETPLLSGTHFRPHNKHKETFQCLDHKNNVIFGKIGMKTNWFPTCEDKAGVKRRLAIFLKQNYCSAMLQKYFLLKSFKSLLSQKGTLQA